MHRLLARTGTELERGARRARTQLRTEGIARRDRRGEGEHSLVLVVVLPGSTVAQASDAFTVLTAKFTFQFVDVSLGIAARGKTSSSGARRRTIERTIPQHPIVDEQTVTTALLPFDGVRLQSNSERERERERERV